MGERGAPVRWSVTNTQAPIPRNSWRPLEKQIINTDGSDRHFTQINHTDGQSRSAGSARGIARRSEIHCPAEWRGLSNERRRVEAPAATSSPPAGALAGRRGSLDSRAPH
jgi:hypothetical protein